MKKLLFGFFGLFQLTVVAQTQEIEKLRLVETSEFIQEPKDILTHLDYLQEKDSVVLITFLKLNGMLLEHGSISKRELLKTLEKTHFRNRYFVVLLGKKAVFYLEGSN
ncbi:hypothetical protein [Flagellimonas nanhaiensis]|uniref:Uncharacterized protein n=1 Tax=Flagellimonas nanhaiensis TaxID=2292706 RepID=A0A371JSU0_9FLAO|nr:hypothetical protein [Allomuricauda nanhaiensis]RDY60872.1 hypothetical protein DX873_01445 [Allomuricauda nanhaiensis]